MAPKPAPDDRAELVAALRAILNAPGDSAKALQAKSTAARQLAVLLGLDAATMRQQVEEEGQAPDPMADLVEEGQAPDPMADLDVMEAERRRRARS